MVTNARVCAEHRAFIIQNTETNVVYQMLNIASRKLEPSKKAESRKTHEAGGIECKKDVLNLDHSVRT